MCVCEWKNFLVGSLWSGLMVSVSVAWLNGACCVVSTVRQPPSTPPRPACYRRNQDHVSDEEDIHEEERGTHSLADGGLAGGVCVCMRVCVCVSVFVCV